MLLQVKRNLWVNPAHIVTIGVMELSNGDTFIVANMTNTAPIGLQKLDPEWSNETVTRLIEEWSEWFALASSEAKFKEPSALALI